MSVIWEYILYALKSFIEWLIGLAAPLFDSLGFGSGSLPDSNISFAEFSSQVSGWYDLCNQWFPCDYALTCFTIYLTIASGIFITNWILGLFPTVS